MLPLLSQFSKISNGYRMVIGRVEALEMKYNDLEKKNESLHQDNAKLQKMVKDLTVKLETKEAEYNKMAISQVDSSVHADDDRISVTSQNCEQVEEFSVEIKNKFLPQKFYVKDDVMYIRAIVDTSKFMHP